jgi:hypothetical protein
MGKVKLPAKALATLLVLLGVAMVASTLVVASASTARATTAAVATAITPNGAWTSYHYDHAHTGFDPSLPGAASAAAGWVSVALDQTVYGEPLVYQGLVYVATLNNSVYALNQTDGSVVWSNHLRAPEAGGWQCGNVAPMGILGTPVIDTVGGRIYVATFGADDLYRLEALSLTTGARVMSTVVTTNASGFDWTIEQERGALALSLDRTHVYVPFGGRAGDCGPYHGYVIGVPTNGTASDELYVTPSTAEGIWASGGPVVDDSTGNVFFNTGNAIPCGGAVNSDSLIRTGPALGAATSYFQPQDWSSHWCGPDLDLGSTSPVMLSPSLIFDAGKYGQGFLLNPANLGGLDGQLFPTPKPASYVGADVCHTIHSDATFGSFAYAAPYVYVECNGGGIEAVQVNTSTPSFVQAFTAGNGTTFGPPVVAGGIIWAVDISGTGLYGFDAMTGGTVFHSTAFGVTHFSTPSEAGGQIFVSSNNQIREFNMTFCTGASVSPTTLTQAAGSTFAYTASSTGCSTPQYEFWVQSPNGMWNLIRGWGGPSFSWDTTGLAPGTYTIHAWVNARGTGHDAIGSATAILTGCTSASLSPLNPTVPANSTVNFTASSGGCPNPIYEFWIQYPNGMWNLARGWAGPTFSWDTTGLAPGFYTVHAWANQTGAAPTLEVYGSSTVTITRCTSASLSPPSVSQPAGSTVALTASANGCVNPFFEFWVQYPDMTWNLKQGWGNSASFSWDTTNLAPGTYIVHAWAARTATTWDAIGSSTVTLTGCTSAAVTPPTVSQAAGTTVAMTASSGGGCPNPVYEFWVQYPNLTWHLARGWDPSASFGWDTTGLAPGVYTVHAWANQLGAAPTLEVYGTATITLTGCNAASLSPSSVSQPAGSTVVLTASSGNCPNPQYEYWVQYPGGAWYLKQGWTPSTTFTWATTGLVPGTYIVHSWVNNQSTGHDDIGSATVTLTGCTSSSVSPPTGSGAVGSMPTFTATSSGCPNPVYEFWLLDPRGTWHLMRSFSSTATWTWDSTGWVRGTYTVHVWANQQGANTATYETIGSATYTLT